MSLYPPPNNPGFGYGYGPPPERINNHLVAAILTTLFCCLPFGIVAIVYAAKVDGLVAAGDWAGARHASDRAKQWSFWSAVSVIVIYGLAFIVALATGGFDESTATY